MKKYIMILALSVVQITHTMDQQIVLSEQDKDKCWLVARYLNKYPDGNNEKEEEKEKIKLFFEYRTTKSFDIVDCVRKYKEAMDSSADAINFIQGIPNKKFEELPGEMKKLDYDVREKVELLMKRNPIIGLAFYKDVFIAQCINYLPESFEDNGGFFKREFYEGVQEEHHHYDHFGMVIAHGVHHEKKSVDKKISREDMIKKLSDMPILKAFFGFRYLTQRDIVKMQSRVEHLGDGCLKLPRYTPKTWCYLSASDLEHLSNDAENLLMQILEKSNAFGDIDHNHVKKLDGLFVIEDEHIKLLQSIKDIRDLDCFKTSDSPFNQALIYIKCKPSTILETIKDKALFGIPFILATAMPDLIYNQTSGFLQGFGGLCATGLGGFMLGHPAIDSCNSGRSKLAEFFGRDNQRKVDRRWLCFVTMAHYLSTIIAQKFLEWGTLPYQIIGGAIYAGKGLFSLCIMQAQENYNDPFKRINSKGYHYTLGDLINGPMFSSKNSDQ